MRNVKRMKQETKQLLNMLQLLLLLYSFRLQLFVMYFELVVINSIDIEML